MRVMALKHSSRGSVISSGGVSPAVDPNGLLLPLLLYQLSRPAHVKLWTKLLVVWRCFLVGVAHCYCGNRWLCHRWILREKNKSRLQQLKVSPCSLLWKSLTNIQQSSLRPRGSAERTMSESLFTQRLCNIAATRALLYITTTYSHVTVSVPDEQCF